MHSCSRYPKLLVHVNEKKPQNTTFTKFLLVSIAYDDDIIFFSLSWEHDIEQRLPSFTQFAAATKYEMFQFLNGRPRILAFFPRSFSTRNYIARASLFGQHPGSSITQATIHDVANVDATSEFIH